MTTLASLPSLLARAPRRRVRWSPGPSTRRGGRAADPSPDPRWSGPVVTFTATAGTPVVELSTAVADALALPRYDEVFPVLVAAATGASLADALDMDGVVPSRLAVAMAWSACHPGAPELDGALAAVRTLERFPTATRDIIGAIATEPVGGVIVGRHAAFVLAGHDRALHVLLDAPSRWRQEALQSEHAWSATAAQEHLRSVDRAQRRYAARAHGVDVIDRSHYGVVVDVSGEDLASMTAVVVGEATRRGIA